MPASRGVSVDGVGQGVVLVRGLYTGPHQVGQGPASDRYSRHRVDCVGRPR